jgi:hypothetical protein
MAQARWAVWFMGAVYLGGPRSGSHARRTWLAPKTFVGALARALLRWPPIHSNRHPETMVISSNALAYIAVINKYLALLAAGDVRGIVSLFSPRGMVNSPFLGVQPVGKFFDLLKAATRRSVLEDPEVFVSGVGSRRASVYFTYQWELADGSQVSFRCFDLFDFDEQGLIEMMTIVYDTAPIREAVGDKYSVVQSH